MSNHNQPRPAVKAVILKNDQLLVLEMRDELGIYYKLPGGGQERFETMEEALVRECAEEISLNVKPDKLLWLADHIFNRPHKTKSDEGHQTEAFFRCYIIDNAAPQAGHVPDDDQIGIAWLPLDQLVQHRLYPLALRERLSQLKNEDDDKFMALYLGKIA
jgi:8-oxo-dGTP diphosphatase